MMNDGGEKLMDFHQFNSGVGSSGHFLLSCIPLKKGTRMCHRISVSSDWINGKDIGEDGEHCKIRFWSEEGRKMTCDIYTC